MSLQTILEKSIFKTVGMMKLSIFSLLVFLLCKNACCSSGDFKSQVDEVAEMFYSNFELSTCKNSSFSAQKKKEDYLFCVNARTNIEITPSFWHIGKAEEAINNCMKTHVENEKHRGFMYPGNNGVIMDLRGYAIYFVYSRKKDKISIDMKKLVKMVQCIECDELFINFEDVPLNIALQVMNVVICKKMHLNILQNYTSDQINEGYVAIYDFIKIPLNSICFPKIELRLINAAQNILELILTMLRFEYVLSLLVLDACAISNMGCLKSSMFSESCSLIFINIQKQNDGSPKALLSVPSSVLGLCTYLSIGFDLNNAIETESIYQYIQHKGIDHISINYQQLLYMHAHCLYNKKCPLKKISTITLVDIPLPESALNLNAIDTPREEKLMYLQHLILVVDSRFPCCITPEQQDMYKQLFSIKHRIGFKEFTMRHSIQRRDLDTTKRFFNRVGALKCAGKEVECTEVAQSTFISTEVDICYSDEKNNISQLLNLYTANKFVFCQKIFYCNLTIYSSRIIRIKMKNEETQMFQKFQKLMFLLGNINGEDLHLKNLNTFKKNPSSPMTCLQSVRLGMNFKRIILDNVSEQIFRWILSNYVFMQYTVLQIKHLSFFNCEVFDLFLEEHNLNIQQVEIYRHDVLSSVLEGNSISCAKENQWSMLQDAHIIDVWSFKEYIEKSNESKRDDIHKNRKLILTCTQTFLEYLQKKHRPYPYRESSSIQYLVILFEGSLESAASIQDMTNLFHWLYKSFCCLMWVDIIDLYIQEGALLHLQKTECLIKNTFSLQEIILREVRVYEASPRTQELLKETKNKIYLKFGDICNSIVLEKKKFEFAAFSFEKKAIIVEERIFTKIIRAIVSRIFDKTQEEKICSSEDRCFNWFLRCLDGNVEKSDPCIPNLIQKDVLMQLGKEKALFLVEQAFLKLYKNDICILPCGHYSSPGYINKEQKKIIEKIKNECLLFDSAYYICPFGCKQSALPLYVSCIFQSRKRALFTERDILDTLYYKETSQAYWDVKTSLIRIKEILNKEA
ncbi:hypothetical protein NEFER03_1374 [Nematocida sp. LUAm3]|nr:hypothetical protein NEFER03_1374 [Nematocida sp. LUAm3]KAI5174796.1 hypothetical protein NEFER02_0906 [Nematocida sp. LUAm2]KAI5177793.1 hypothetical protein NEFER01_0995 [Nematocida sp. LUAm1]